MNRCLDARSALPAYVENELTPVEHRLVAGHLELCSACRQEEAAFRAALVALSTAPRPVHGDLFSGLSARIDALSARPSIRPRQLRWAAGLACLLLAFGVGAVVARSWLSGSQKEDGGSAASSVKLSLGVGSGSRSGSGATALVPSVPAHPPTAASPNSNDTNEDYTDRRAAPPAKRTAAVRIDPNTPFDQVRDKSGRSARDYENELKRTGVISSHPGYAPGSFYKRLPSRDDALDVRLASIPGAPEVKYMVGESEKQLKVGDTDVKMRRETGYDSNGDLALIRISTEASPKPGGEDKTRKGEPERNH